MSEQFLKCDTNLEKDYLKNLLREQILTIEFVKKDGTVRKMLCTLDADKIPSEKMPKNSGKAQSDDVLAVFDIEKQDWRSFRYESIKNFQFGV